MHLTAKQEEIEGKDSAIIELVEALNNRTGSITEEYKEVSLLNLETDHTPVESRVGRYERPRTRRYVMQEMKEKKVSKKNRVSRSRDNGMS